MRSLPTFHCKINQGSKYLENPTAYSDYVQEWPGNRNHQAQQVYSADKVEARRTNMLFVRL